MRTWSDTLRDTIKAGASFDVRGERLEVDFGQAEIPASLLDDLRAHAETIREYLPRLVDPPPKAVLELEVAFGGERITFAEWTPWDRLEGDVIAVDTETTIVNLKDPAEAPPRLVLGIGTDGNRGFFIRPEEMVRFLESHPEATFVFHHAPFDAEVIAGQEGKPLVLSTIGGLVDSDRIVDTLEMERLIQLARTSVPPKRVSLDQCSTRYLRAGVEKDHVDRDGDPIRMSFEKYLGKSPSEMPRAFLEYAATDAIATRAVWRHQVVEADKIAREIAPRCFGFTSAEALQEAWKQNGPLGIQIQIRASMVAKMLWRAGVDFDQGRRAELDDLLLKRFEAEASKLRSEGIVVPGPGERTPKGQVAVATLIRKRLVEIEPRLLEDGRLASPFTRTATGQICLDAEVQADFAEKGLDPIVTAYGRMEKYRRLRNLLGKMAVAHGSPEYRTLLASGRFSCFGIPIQTFPKCGRGESIWPTIRQIVRPPEGHVFTITDYSQLELRSLAAVWKKQLGFGDSLWKVIDTGLDVHTALATEMLGREPTKTERNQIKATSFGAPAGMMVGTIVADAKASYGQIVTEEQVSAALAAYHRMAPELTSHLRKTRKPGIPAMRLLELKKLDEAYAVLSILAPPWPGSSSASRSQEETEQLWDLAQGFLELIPDSTPAKRLLRKHLVERKPSKALRKAISTRLVDEGVLTMSGRIRGICSFTESRNQIFQGAAADGAILAVWELFRAGFDVRIFMHDEAVVSIPNDVHREEALARIESIMISTMSEALGGIRVEVESHLSESWSTIDKAEGPPPTRSSEAPSSSSVSGKKSLLRGIVEGRAKADTSKRSSSSRLTNKKPDRLSFEDDLPF